MAMFWSISAGLLVAAMLFYILFRDWDEFVHCVKFYFTPDVISLFQGKWDEDMWAELKLLVWLGLSVATGGLVYINY